MAKTVTANQISAPQPDISTGWLELKSWGSGVSDGKWERRKPPSELVTLPASDEIPVEIVNIRAWSLLRTDPASPTEEKRAKPVSEDGSQTASNELPAEEFSYLSPAIEVSNRSGRRLRTPSTSSSPHSHRSASVENRKSGFRSLKTGVLTSTVDLLEAMKLKLDPARRADLKTNEQPSSATTITIECVSCFEEFNTKEVTTLACTHSYCSTCFTTIITTAMQVEASFPPKCCLNPIPLQTIIRALQPVQRELYKQKAAEYGVPAGKRWYCPSPKCGKWIPPKRISVFRLSTQTCPHCSRKICSTCRGSAHDGDRKCPQDYGLEQTLDMAEEEGWQRCFKCRAMVELTAGCRHMTCKCGAQFCYVCGVKWKTCKCTEMDQQRRQEEARRRRAERDSEAAVEAEEVARAIAEVEEFERQEEQRLKLEDEKRERDREEEEELLAVWEQIRLAEEQERIQEEGEHERQRAEALRLSIEDRSGFLRGTLEKLIQTQKSSLQSRHEFEEQGLIQDFEREQKARLVEAEALLRRINANILHRTNSMHEKHKTETETLTSKQEEEEDDLFLQIQIHLRGKPNRETREERMRREFEKHLSEQRTALSGKQQAEEQVLEKISLMDREGVERSLQNKNDAAEKEHRSTLRKLGRRIGADRKWFEVVTERRIHMLQLHNKTIMEEVEAGKEPHGLTIAMASKVLPLPPIYVKLVRTWSWDHETPPQSAERRPKDWNFNPPTQRQSLSLIDPQSFSTTQASDVFAENRYSIDFSGPNALDITPVVNNRDSAVSMTSPALSTSRNSILSSPLSVTSRSPQSAEPNQNSKIGAFQLWERYGPRVAGVIPKISTNTLTTSPTMITSAKSTSTLKSTPTSPVPMPGAFPPTLSSNPKPNVNPSLDPNSRQGEDEHALFLSYFFPGTSQVSMTYQPPNPTRIDTITPPHSPLTLRRYSRLSTDSKQQIQGQRQNQQHQQRAEPQPPSLSPRGKTELDHSEMVDTEAKDASRQRRFSNASPPPPAATRALRSLSQDQPQFQSRPEHQVQPQLESESQSQSQPHCPSLVGLYRVHEYKGLVNYEAA